MKFNKSYLTAALLLVGLLIVYFLASYVVPRTLVTLTKAAPSSKVSITNSYFIGGKLLAKADGTDMCVVNFFALDDSGKGVRDKSVTVSGMGSDLLEVTGVDGKARFEIKSKVEGQYKLTAMVDGVPIGREVSVTFRN